MFCYIVMGSKKGGGTGANSRPRFTAKATTTSFATWCWPEIQLLISQMEGKIVTAVPPCSTFHWEEQE